MAQTIILHLIIEIIITNHILQINYHSQIYNQYN